MGLAVSLASSFVYTPPEPCQGTETFPCIQAITCSDPTTGRVVSYKRLTPPVDTNDADLARAHCAGAGMELPSIHSELENFCIQKGESFSLILVRSQLTQKNTAGEHGEKSRVTLGLEYNVHRQNWVWDDDSSLDFSKIWPPNWDFNTLSQPDREKRWCARLVGFSILYVYCMCFS